MPRKRAPGERTVGNQNGKDLCGVYRIDCTANGLVYIGSADGIFKRWKTHLSELKAGRHKNPIMKACFDKYGAEALDFSIIELVPPNQNLLVECEQTWMNEVPKEKRMFCQMAQKSGQWGCERSEEARANISAATGGREVAGIDLQTGEIKEWPFLSKTNDDGFDFRLVYKTCTGQVSSHKSWFFWFKNEPIAMPRIFKRGKPGKKRNDALLRKKKFEESKKILGTNLKTLEKKVWKNCAEVKKDGFDPIAVALIVREGLNNRGAVPQSHKGWFFCKASEPRALPEKSNYDLKKKPIIRKAADTYEEVYFSSVSDALSDSIKMGTLSGRLNKNPDLPYRGYLWRFATVEEIKNHEKTST